jgi:membrane-associated phospholipid phosphatase
MFILSTCLVGQVYSQNSSTDSLFHPYHVNYWITGSTIVAGLTLEKIGVAWISDKATITAGELDNLDRHDITPIDSWALHFDPAQRDYYGNTLSTELASIGAFLPAFTMLDGSIRHDWLDILLMYMQTQAITNNFYLYSPFGATFQNRFRPIVYYTDVSLADRTTSNNRNSLYSGHVSSVAAGSFFTAKVFCDYHPELGNNKYLVYGAAAIPPLVMSYFRLRALEHFPTDMLVGFGVGAFFGIIIPELHRVQDKNLSFSMYSTSEATGVSMTWHTDFLK